MIKFFTKEIINFDLANIFKFKRYVCCIKIKFLNIIYP